MDLEISVFPRRDASAEELKLLGKALLQWERPKANDTPRQNFGQGIFDLLEGRLPGRKPQSDCLNGRVQPCVWILINTAEDFEVQELLASLRSVLPQATVQDVFIDCMSWRWIGPEAKAAIPEMCAVLKEEDAGHARDEAICALSRIGAEAVQPLIQMLGDRDPSVRYTVLAALGQIGPAAAPATTAIIEAISDKDQFVCCRALRTLGDIGPAATLAVPILLQTLNDEDYLVRRSAATALRKVAPDTDIDASLR